MVVYIPLAPSLSSPLFASFVYGAARFSDFLVLKNLPYDSRYRASSTAPARLQATDCRYGSPCSCPTVSSSFFAQHSRLYSPHHGQLGIEVRSGPPPPYQGPRPTILTYCQACPFQGKNPHQGGSPFPGPSPSRLADHQEIGQACTFLEHAHRPADSGTGTPRTSPLSLLVLLPHFLTAPKANPFSHPALTQRGNLPYEAASASSGVLIILGIPSHCAPSGAHIHIRHLATVFLNGPPDHALKGNAPIANNWQYLPSDHSLAPFVCFAPHQRTCARWGKHYGPYSPQLLRRQVLLGTHPPHDRHPCQRGPLQRPSPITCVMIGIHHLDDDLFHTHTP
jgi:hypothetical protein